MGIKTLIDPFDRDVQLLISNTLSRKGQSGILAQAAREELAKGQDRNRAALGHVPPHRTFVDQSENAPIESVRPDGVIVFEFQLVETALAWIAEMLVRNSPVKSGRYQDSHILFADGVAVEPGNIPPLADEFVFLNAMPYSRRIERGWSPQRPEGVYDATATLAKRRFGNIASIRFGFRSFPSGAVGDWAQTGSARALAKRVRKGRESAHTEWLTRQPAIVISPFGGRR